ncbi:MAG: hypothetical protein WAX89_02105 [Alphaproteobacteria bacterium]
MSRLQDEVKNLANKAKGVQKQRSDMRKSRDLVGIDLDRLNPSRDVTKLFERLQQEIKQETKRYTMAAVAAPEAPAADEMSQFIAGIDTAIPPTAAPAAPAPAAPVPADAPFQPLPRGPFTHHFANTIERAFQQTYSNALVGHSLPERRLFDLIETEVQRISDSLASFGSAGLNTLQKLRKASSYVGENNLGACLRLLKGAKATDPNNNVLAYLISQIGYFQAANGHGDALPDARNEGQKCGAVTDLVPAEVLMQYRYDSAVCERGFTDKKPFDWLVEFYLLDAEQMGVAGLTKAQAMHLKSWLLLATIPTQHWNDYVFGCMKGMAMHTVGGAAFYVHVLRPKVMTEMKNRAVPPAAVQEIETALSSAYAAYLEIAGAFQTGWVERGTGSNAWTVRNRFLTDFKAVSAIPQFDEVLLHVSLDGRGYEKDAFPTNEFKAKGYPKELYWRLWSVSITPEERVTQILPVSETALESSFYRDSDILLTTFKEVENGLIKQEQWKEVEPLLLRLSMDHILAAGTRSPKPRNKFYPTVPPFSGFYREWEVTDKTPRVSVLLAESAARGAFASIQEVMVSFEGAALLLEDPRYGLKAQQEYALEQLKRKGQGFITNMASSMSIGQMILYIFVPLAVMSFLVALVMRMF